MKTTNQFDQQKETILFVDSREDHKNAFVDLLKNTEYQVIWLENSFKAIQWLKNHGAQSVLLMVVDGHIKPLSSFQTYDYIKNELDLNVPVLVVHEQDDTPDYSEYPGLDYIKRNNNEENLNKIKEIASQQLEFNGYNPKAYSLNYLREVSDNNEEFIASSMALFLNSVSDRMNDMKKAISNQKYKEVSEIAHNIKPSFAMIENEAGRTLCDTMAHSAKEEEMFEMVNKLNTLFFELKEQLQTDFPAYDAL
ncbi:Hpt domain-containing protein [Gaetbulibacter aestuarii]|uniref:Hpt domain-containing protein n=1 Tax=Gaetbulibacter aestuarii TaxID=1502358 RepID=A0ABW7N4C7_9FLAO